MGSETLFLLLALLPYQLLVLLLVGYVQTAKSIMSGRLRTSGRYVSASGVEFAQFWTKWTLHLRPIFVSLAFATALLSVTEAVTGRAIVPLAEGPRSYCRYTGNQDRRAVFACRDPAIGTSPSARNLALLHAYHLQRICTDPVYAWFRRTETAFRFVYSEGWRTLATIDVSDRECKRPPPQP